MAIIDIGSSLSITQIKNLIDEKNSIRENNLKVQEISGNAERSETDHSALVAFELANNIDITV
jgi:hypothetical protein